MPDDSNDDPKSRHFQFSLRTMLLVFPVMAVGLLLTGFCAGIIRPARPPFANEYAVHPDGRPPWPRWWIHPPEMDGTGTSFRTDHTLNLVMLLVSNDPDEYLNPVEQVFDEEGQLLLNNGNAVLNTPNIQEARNRLFAVDRDGGWHEFEIPAGFAQGLEGSFRHLDWSKEQRVLEGLQSFAESRRLPSIAKWIAEQK